MDVKTGDISGCPAMPVNAACLVVPIATGGPKPRNSISLPKVAAAPIRWVRISTMLKRSTPSIIQR